MNLSFMTPEWLKRKLKNEKVPEPGGLMACSPELYEEMFNAFNNGGTKMHYKNGRMAKNGDKVVVFPSYGPPYVGILYDATPGNDYCNGKIAIARPGDPTPNLQECLHLDDVKGAIPDLALVPDTSKVEGPK